MSYGPNGQSAHKIESERCPDRKVRAENAGLHASQTPKTVAWDRPMSEQTVTREAASGGKRRMLGPWWSLNERGFSFGMRFVLVCHRLIGQRFIEFILWPISSCYYLTAGARRRAILTYLDRVE